MTLTVGEALLARTSVCDACHGRDHAPRAPLVGVVLRPTWYTDAQWHQAMGQDPGPRAALCRACLRRRRGRGDV